MKKETIEELLGKHAEGLSDEQRSALVEALAAEAGKEEDRRATEATRTAVANYEKKHGIKDGKPIEEPAPAPGASVPAKQEPKPSDNDMPEWAKSMMTELAALKGERSNAARRTQFDALLDPLPVHLRTAYSRTPIETLSDEDFAALTTAVGQEVKDTLSELKTQGMVFKPKTSDNGGGGGTQKATEAELDAVFKSSPALG